MNLQLRNNLFLFWVLFSQFLFAQENISSSRPGQCIGSQTIDKGVLQFQSGIQSDFGVNDNNQLPNTIVRYALFEHMEIRVADELNNYRKKWHLDTPEFSVLIDITKGNKWLPELVLCVFSNAGLMKQNLYNGVILSGANRITDSWSYSFIVTGKYDTKMNGGYALALNYNVNKFTPYVEVYGDMVRNGMKFDTGFAYLLNKDIQLDLYGGSDFAFEQFFITTGVSFRFFK